MTLLSSSYLNSKCQLPSGAVAPTAGALVAIAPFTRFQPRAVCTLIEATTRKVHDSALWPQRLRLAPFLGWGRRNNEMTNASVLQCSLVRVC